jgi:hypothetical protein
MEYSPYHHDMSVRSRRSFRIAVAIALLAALAVAARRPILRTVGHALVVDDPVANADVVVVSQWAGDGGAIEAADLVRTGMADRAAVVGPPVNPGEQELKRRGVSLIDNTDQVVRVLHALGVKNVERIDSVAGTQAESDLLQSWCDERRFRTIVVVSAPDHSRRLRRILRRSLAGHSTNAVIRSARFSVFDPDRWWETRDGLRIGIIELEKLLLDVARHPIS